MSLIAHGVGVCLLDFAISRHKPINRERDIKMKKRVFKRIAALCIAAIVMVATISVPAEKVLAASMSLIVNIPDANLKAVINKKLGKNEKADITQSQLESLTYLSVWFEDVKSIEGLQYCINLVDLNLTGNDIEDISPLGSCRKLKELDLSRNEKLKDLSPISVCTQLTYLSLENCKGISDISPLRSLTKLKDLDLEKVCITSENSQAYMNTIKSLTNLTSLCLAWCDVKDEHTSMLNSLTKLTKLTIGGNYLSNPGFLEKHTNLTQLSIFGTDVGNSAVYSKLTNLDSTDCRSSCLGSGSRFLCL